MQEFTDEDLRLIAAMCQTANPQYPNQEMHPAFKSLYEKTNNMLSSQNCPDMCHHPDCG